VNQAARKLDQRGRAERYRLEELELRQVRQRERSVRHRARMTRHAYASFVMVTLALFALLFTVARLNISSAQKALKAREMQEEAEEERKAQETLKTEVARLESSARIEKVAERELGMVRAKGSLVVRLRPGEEGAATGAASPPLGSASAGGAPEAGMRSIQ
jgi:cell division protein FtsL